MNRRSLKYGLLGLALAMALAGCGAQEQKPASTLTQAERDTALARSSLPGAVVVGRALDVSGQAADRAAGMDSTGH